MTDAELELARRLVAHPEWEWLGGILAEADGDERTWRLVAGSWMQEAGESTRPRPSELLPALDDPATLGCLWAMLGDKFEGLERNVYGDETWWTVFIDVNIERDLGQRHMPKSTSLGAALGLALLWMWQAAG